MTPKRTGASDDRPPSGAYVLGLGLLVAVAIGLTTWTVAGGAGSALELTGDEQPAGQVEQSPTDLTQSDRNGSTDDVDGGVNGSDESDDEDDERDEDDEDDEDDERGEDDEDDEDDRDDERDEDDRDDERDEDDEDDERGPPDDVGPPDDDDDEERADFWDAVQAIFGEDDNVTEDEGG